MGHSEAPAFTEVDAAGDVLIGVTIPLGDLAYRTTKVPVGRLDLDVMRRTAGGGS
ncbi:MAG: hypothetical protein HYV09_13695 [Deltaproteobacteria bacterium]|nr:hypothetical protein [Deltaproteobacteria bacterium]